MFDSIQSSMDQKTKVTFRFNSRNSFITDRRARIFGFKLGVDFNNTLRMGGGFNILSSDLYREKIVMDSLGMPDTIASRLHFGYLAYYIEYVFYKTKRWEFSIPIQLGFGNSRFEHDYEGDKIIEHKKMVIVYEPAVSGQYRFFEWAGVGMDVGYRFMLLNNKAIQQNLNSPIYAFKLLIFIGPLYRSVFKKEE